MGIQYLHWIYKQIAQQVIISLYACEYSVKQYHSCTAVILQFSSM